MIQKFSKSIQFVNGLTIFIFSTTLLGNANLATIPQQNLENQEKIISLLQEIKTKLDSSNNKNHYCKCTGSKLIRVSFVNNKKIDDIIDHWTEQKDLNFYVSCEKRIASHSACS